MRRGQRTRSLLRNIATSPSALLAATILLISPVGALGSQGSQGNQNTNNQDGGGWVPVGCVSSPENPSVILAALGALGGFVIPKARQKLARKRGVADSK
jgi:hypothetical protein